MFTSGLFVIAIATIVVFIICLFFFEYVVKNISDDYKRVCRTLLPRESTSIEDCETMIQSGDVLLVLSPVHYVDTVSHVALAVRSSSSEIAILEHNLRGRPYYVTFKDFIRAYASHSPVRVVIRRLRQNVNGMLTPLCTEKLISCINTIMCYDYDYTVASRQINRWILKVGLGAIPLVPQPSTLRNSYCSAVVMQILILYGVLDPRMASEQTIMGPYEWLLPAHLSRRRFPIEKSINGSFRYMKLLQCNLEGGMVPTTYYELYKCRKIIAAKKKERMRRTRMKGIVLEHW
jgi:hypothetical protein